ncbi:SMP-30/gluconolactonase/LRE family protein [Epibacterium ulvae]|uniref:SMP-30/gluconolactonase/LRE family protein n=1 Tax=Epibacterium ulvae TaxID=1156985 RepID=UPI002490A393|nr:SMP-30/gluconolactonase/LRE family protein [Epibacterium ulvae]
MRDVKCVDRAAASCGEGLLWDHAAGVLWWVDIAHRFLHSYAPATGRCTKLPMPDLISAVALHDSGKLLIATKSGLGWVNPETGTITLLDCPEPDLPGNRPNDMAVAPDGALWLGTMSEGAKGATGALYRYDATGRTLMMKDTTISNGLDWSPDGERFYFIDSVPGRIWLRKADDWQVLRTCDEDFGRPDGLCVDSAGTIWVAICNQGRVLGLSPDGQIIETIEIPCRTVTNCAFGGEDLQTLYVTTGTFDLSAEDIAQNPESGGLFAIQMDVPGRQPYVASAPMIG